MSNYHTGLIPCPQCHRQHNPLWNDFYGCGCGFAGYRMEVYAVGLAKHMGAAVYTWVRKDGRRLITTAVYTYAGVKVSDKRQQELKEQFFTRILPPIWAGFEAVMRENGASEEEIAECRRSLLEERHEWTAPEARTFVSAEGLARAIAEASGITTEASE